jgi:ribosomal protein S12 methylthiotransferase accessory factor
VSATVGLVGEGPAVAAVGAALGDADATVERGEVSLIGEAATDLDLDLAVVAGVAGSDGFGRANELALAADCPWFAVEVGGVGGQSHPDVAAAVTGFRPGGPCYECLRARVAPADGTPRGDRADVRLAGAVAGRRAVRALAGEFQPGIVEVPAMRERTLLPVPGCECGDADGPGAFERTHRDVDVETAAGRAEAGVDERVGLVALAGERESFPAPYYLAQLRDAPYLDAEVPDQAAGVDADWDRAYVKALGEAYERYAAAAYDADRFERGPAGSVPDAVPVERFVRPDDAPVPGPEESIPWVAGTDLATGERVHLPAEFVHFPPPEERLRPAITTGLGLGSSPVEAALSGLAEAVERDATMLAWYSTFEPLGLAVDTPEFRTLARRARAEDLAVTPLLVTQDVDVPVVAVAVHRGTDDGNENGDGGWPRFAVGSAARLDAAGAARAALCEALQNWMELRAMGPEDAERAGGAVARYADFPPEIRDLVDPETRVPAAEVGPDDPPAGAAALDALVERVTDAGLDAYVARLTPRDVADLGFEAVRVLVPAAQPLFVGDAYFGERARTVPRDLGFRPRLDRPYHPYP